MTYIVRIDNKGYEVEVERGRANLTKTTEITASEPSPAAPADGVIAQVFATKGASMATDDALISI